MAKISLKSTAGIGILLIILSVAGVEAYVFVRGRHSTPAEALPKSNNSSTTSATPTKEAASSSVKSVAFTYTAPKGWVQLTQPTLGNEGADSGIARLTAPAAKFTVAVEPPATSPSTTYSLNSQVMSVLSKFTNFKLIGQKNVTVAGATGSQYDYTFGDSTKMQQSLTVLIHNKQTYSLLFTCPQSTFASQTGTLATIIKSFKFTN